MIDTIEQFTPDAVDAACEGLVPRPPPPPRSVVESPTPTADRMQMAATTARRPAAPARLAGLRADRRLGTGNCPKAGWYSPFPLAAYDPTSETYDSVCRCMSAHRRLHEEKTETFGKRAVGGEAAAAGQHASETNKTPTFTKAREARLGNTLERPDVWFVPPRRWKCVARTRRCRRSTPLPPAPGTPSAGSASRSPRFVAARPDKSPEDASGPAEVLALFDAQARRWGQEASAERRLREIQRAREVAPDAFGEEREEEEEEVSEEETSAGGE